MSDSTARLSLPALYWPHEALALAYAGMEISWLTPYFLALVPPARLLPPYLTAFLLAVPMLGYYGWARLAERRQIDVGRERLVMLLALPVTVLLGWRIFLHPGMPLGDLSWIQQAGSNLLFGGSSGHWVVALTALYLWWRGVSLSRRTFEFEPVSFAFRSGLLLLVFGTLLLSYIVGFQVNAFIFPFFFFSLVAVALTRLEEVGQVKGDVGQLFSLYWLLVLGAAIGLVLLAGGLFTQLASPEGIDALLRLWAPIGDALVQVIAWVLTIVLTPFAPILEWLAELFARGWQILFENAPDFLTNLEFPAVEGEEALAAAYLPLAMEVVRSVCGIGLLLAVFLVVLWVLNKERRRLREQREAHESLDVSLVDALAGLLRNARSRLRGAWASMAQFGAGSDLLAAISVRNIYANTTRLARKRGYPRGRARTPYEYLPDLQSAFPQAPEDAQRITEAYVGVHYGELPSSRAELAELRAAYERLRSSPVPERPGFEQP